MIPAFQHLASIAVRPLPVAAFFGMEHARQRRQFREFVRQGELLAGTLAVLGLARPPLGGLVAVVALAARHTKLTVV